MRKLLAVFMVLLLIAGMLCMAGCNEEEAQLTVSEGVLTVSLSPDFAPMEFVDTSKSGQEQYVGVDVKLAQAIADEMGLGLVIKPMSFEACQSAVLGGAVDMSISGYAYTEERAQKFLISDFYKPEEFEELHMIVVRSEDADKYKTAEDFGGVAVGAQASSIQLDLCHEDLPDNTEVVEYAGIDGAIQALKEGKIEGVAVADGRGEIEIENSDGELAASGFYFEWDDKATENIVLMQKGREDLAAYVNKVIAAKTESGELHQWYEECSELAKSENAKNVVYDEKGEETGE